MDGKDIEGRVDRMQAQIRNDFPILEQKINNNPLIYFDNGATTQMPNCVLECLNTVWHLCGRSVVKINQRIIIYLLFQDWKIISDLCLHPIDSSFYIFTVHSSFPVFLFV